MLKVFIATKLTLREMLTGILQIGTKGPRQEHKNMWKYKYH